MADSSTARLRRAGFFLGFALGGFFDGILLHQILQWHHLLSNVEAVDDMRLQILADGLFHALMYLIAALALVQLWRARKAALQPGAGPALWGCACMGFGSWHIADGLLSHWLLGIHRIKVDSPNPLIWDLAWFAVFGLLPLAIGWRMARNHGGRGGEGGGGAAAAAVLSLAALLAGPLAALPAAGGSTQVAVLFAPGVGSGRAFDALSRVDARVLWADRSGGLWIVDMADPAIAWQLYRHGALLVGNSAVAAGCFSWIKAPADRRT